MHSVMELSKVMVNQLSRESESVSEHRKSTRYRVGIPAIVLHEGIQVLSVEIGDFCQNGLFLVTDHQQIPAFLDQGSQITIQFSNGDAEAPATCSLDATIIRISNEGLGVQLLKQSPKVLEILANLSKQFHSDSDQSTDANDVIDKRHSTQIVTEILDRHLPNLAEQCLDECYEMISNRMSAPESNQFANQYFEALSELRSKKLDVLHAFLDAQQRVLMRDWSDQTQPEQTDESLFIDDLSLVDENEFEDWLAIEEMSRRIEQNHEELLAELTTQLTQMIKIHDPQRDNVIAPNIICQSFNDALCETNFDSSTRAVIYPGLEQGLQLYLDQFYQNLGQEFSTQGYHPLNKKSRVARQAKKPVQPVQSAQTGTSLEPESVEADLQTSAVDSSAQTQQLAPLDQVSELDSLAQVLQSMQMMSTGFSQGQTVTPVQTVPLSQNADDVREIINNLGPADTNSNDAVKTLQEQILRVLLGQQQDQLVVDKQKSATLAATTQIFEALKTQAATEKHTQSYIQQLQLPFLHHALTHDDGDDVNADVVQHIIDLLDQVISLIGDSRKPWAVEARKNISELVQRVVNESVDRPEVFKDAEQELLRYADKALHSRTKAEQKLIETCEGQQRVRKAKRQANLILEQYVGGRKIPAIVPRLLKSGWKHVLVRSELRDGIDSDQWEKVIGVIGNLIEWLSVPEGLQSVPEDQLQSLLDLVDQQLSDIGIDTAKQQNISDELVALLLGTGTPRVVRPAKLVRIKSPTIDSENEKSDDLKCHWVDSLQVGDWCEFDIGKGRTEALKLLWLGNDPWHSVFVNQRGAKRLEFSKPQLIKHYQSKLVTKVDSPEQPIATRAKHAVVEKVYSEIRHQSLEDPRVGLPNNKGLLAYLREAEFDSEATLIVVEIDDYRVISQACGMEASDDVVKEIANRMKQQSSANALLARIDDQTLAMVLPDTSVDSFYPMASGWGEGLRTEPFKYGTQSFPIILSIGMIGFTQETLHVEDLVRNVVVACASARQSGRNQIKVYSNEDRQLQQQAEQLEWAGHIDKTLAENRLVLACQPIVHIATYSEDQHKISGQHYEILLRVLDAKGRIGPPGSFLSAGEQLRRMPDIDRWVIINLMQWMNDNLELVGEIDGFSINLSGQSVASESFLRFVTEQVFEVNFDPSKLTFEITETVAIDDFDYVKKFIQHMKKLGCKFSLDDFGSGYASYSYLRNLDVNYLKIDGMFVKDLHNNSKDLMMVKSMNDIAHSLGLKTIAEFVENNEILKLLREIGIDYAQGYHVGKPSPISGLVETYEESLLASA